MWTPPFGGKINEQFRLEKTSNLTQLNYNNFNKNVLLNCVNFCHERLQLLGYVELQFHIVYKQTNLHFVKGFTYTIYRTEQDIYYKNNVFIFIACLFALE